MAGSGNSRLSRSFELLVVVLFAGALAAAAAGWFLAHGYTLYYGDAEAHLNIARRVVDSRTPGYFQFGTVWLPLPHLLILPFVKDDAWWRTGVAGAVPSAACFLTASVFLFAAVRRLFDGRAAAVTALLVFALNPNLLYLQSTAMTEPLFFALAAALLYFTVRFRETQSTGPVLCAGLCALAATLARYEGWFLIPFATLYFLLAAKRKRFFYAAVFGATASLGPLYWLAHNWWYYGDFFEFYRGPFSARAIYQRALNGGMARYPGDGAWKDAWIYFTSAARLCAGAPLFWMAVPGLLAALWKRAFWAVIFLLAAPAFYVWSVHSGGTPIYVPHLWPNSYYNTRYGLSVLPALALAAGALVAIAPARYRKIAAAVVVVAAVFPWLRQPGPEAWICWKESQVNSEARRAWTREAAEFMGRHYRGGSGIFLSFGDLTGILRETGIPIRESLYDGNVPLWDAVLARPDLFLREEWAVAISGDRVSDTIVKTGRRGPRYERVKTIARKGGPVIQIYRRQGGGTGEP